MRITGGSLKGRQILFLKNSNIRPTTDKTRSAIFSILGDISNCSILDVCCGTGAFGIEAISRGAKSATFIDIDTENLKKNIDLIKGKEFNVIKGDFTKKIPLL
ncbi:MAG: RsmD family RNA methyltransferase, partial [Calditerrivibrio sp.]|nr:RsmD family RNA methyltransferase [Calditerrivibrio sp.]